MAVQTEELTQEFTDRLKQQILNFKPAPSRVDVGEVVEVGDGIAGHIRLARGHGK